MTTERQIAANRLNSAKSTGPRSKAAKQRASRNAYRHGLSLSLTSSAAIAKRLDVLARKIAGSSKNEIILEHARAAAQAELDLARVRQVRVALIERVSAIGSFETPQVFGSAAQGIRYLKSILSGRSPPAMPERIDSLATMPTEGLGAQPKPYAGRCCIGTNPERSLGATGRSDRSPKKV